MMTSPRPRARALRAFLALAVAGAVAIFIAPLPAAAQTFDEGMELKRAQKLPEATRVFAALAEREPANVEVLEQWATVLSWQQQLDESIAVWRRALAVDPARVLTLVGLARVTYWKGEHPAARRLLDDALAKDPEHFEALVLAGDVALAQQELGVARGYYERASVLDATVPELQKKLAITRGKVQFRFDAGGSVDLYDEPGEITVRQSAEGLFFIQAGAALRPGLSVSAGWEHARWFAKVNNRFNLQGAWQALPSVNLSARVAGTPFDSDDETADDGRFLPRYELGGALELRLTRNLNLIAAGRFDDYTSGGVGNLLPAVRVTLGNLELFAQLGVTFSPPGTTAAGIGRLSYSIRERVTAILGGAYGEEAFRQPNEQGGFDLRISKSTTVFGGVIVAVTERFGVRLDSTFENRPDFWKRVTNSIAFTFKP